MTQEQAAERSGVSQSTLTRIETGVREYKEHHLDALARAYLCTPAQLIGADPNSSGRGADIVDIWDHIPKEQRAAAQQMLQALATNGTRKD